MSALYLRANKSFERDLRETSYLQQDKVPAPDNIKASLNTQIKKIEYAFINVKSLMVAHENFFSDDNQNITEVYVRIEWQYFNIWSDCNFGEDQQ